ncbi:MAG: hypothetical protein WD009_13700 [Phycisphaeraceae bacterium]
MRNVLAPTLAMLLATAALIVVACDTVRAPAPAPAPAPATAPTSATATVQNADAGQVVPLGPLRDRIAYDSPTVTPGSGTRGGSGISGRGGAGGGGAMQVAVPVRLRGGGEVDAEYRFLFLTERGEPVGQPASWQPARLTGRATHLTGQTTERRATRWRVELRPAR